MSAVPVAISPGRGLGWVVLGASLHSVISKVKSQPQVYPTIDLAHSPTHPTLEPIVLSLPSNGLRLRFDGPDQRLRLIEVLDFSRIHLTYKNVDLVKQSRSHDEQDPGPPRPAFRHIYNRLFGPAYKGEYSPPERGHRHGTYALSYPGLAFLFPVEHKSWSNKADFVSMLSSTATGPATSMAIFEGSSWPEARSRLFVASLSQTQAPHSNDAATELMPSDVDLIRLSGGGRVDVVRRNGTTTHIQLGQSTPQDLVAEFGPPDAIYRKHDSKVSIHATTKHSSRRGSSISPSLDPIEADHSSIRSYSEESEIENADPSQHATPAADEHFYNYFHHGFDALISFPTSRSPSFPSEGGSGLDVSGTRLTVVKVILHGNIPGSYCFNRHRRCRWTIQIPGNDTQTLPTSEMSFSEIASLLRKLWRGTYATAEEERQMQRGMILNRGWGDSPDSSMEILGGFEDPTPREQAQSSNTSNTELFGFPGMLFEVLKNDVVSCLTIY